MSEAKITIKGIYEKYGLTTPFGGDEIQQSDAWQENAINILDDIFEKFEIYEDGDDHD